MAGMPELRICMECMSNTEIAQYTEFRIMRE